MRLLFNIKNQGKIEIRLKDGNRAISKTHLTISQGFDTLLIKALDKMFCKNEIDRLSLKSVEISGKTTSGALSGMILETTAKALNFLG